jgi:Ca2+-binding RTX toxin-like protein
VLTPEGPTLPLYCYYMVLSHSATVAVLVALFGVPAFAKILTGTNGSDEITGTPRADQINGLNGLDFLDSKSGADDLYGGRRKDSLGGDRGADQVTAGRRGDAMFGGFGNDRIYAHDGVANTGEAGVIICGRGVDRAFVDNGPVVFDNPSPDCEYVNGKKTK